MLIDGDRLSTELARTQYPQVDEHRPDAIGASRNILSTAIPTSCARTSTSPLPTPRSDPAPIISLLVPKRKQIREGLTLLDLWIDHSSLLLTAMRMTFAGGETKLMTLEDVVA